ncbi:MAG: Ig-like domain-containing protein, partial [Prevotellaceae bacterium]|nr:Ig-like domain-containing protein [Prevotellaceae bacterium]
MKKSFTFKSFLVLASLVMGLAQASAQGCADGDAITTKWALTSDVNVTAGINTDITGSTVTFGASIDDLRTDGTKGRGMKIKSGNWPNTAATMVDTHYMQFTLTAIESVTINNIVINQRRESGGFDANGYHYIYYSVNGGTFEVFSSIKGDLGTSLADRTYNPATALDLAKGDVVTFRYVPVPGNTSSGNSTIHWSNNIRVNGLTCLSCSGDPLTESPTALVADLIGENGFTATWIDLASETAGTTYTVEVFAGATATGTAVATYEDIAGEIQSQEVTGLTASTQYTFKVTATGDDTNFCGITSATETLTTTACALADPAISFSALLAVNDDLENGSSTKTATTASDGVITYSSSNTTIATVDASGVVTYVKGGTVTITASVPRTASYCAGSAFYTLTIADNTVPGAYTYTCEGFNTVFPTSGASNETTYETATGIWIARYMARDTGSGNHYEGTSGIKRTNSSNMYLITPKLTQGIGTLSFWVKASNSSHGYNIYTTTAATPGSGSTWTQIGTMVTPSEGGSFEFFEIEIDDPTVTAVRFIPDDNNALLDYVCITPYDPSPKITVTNNTLTGLVLAIGEESPVVHTSVKTKNLIAGGTITLTPSNANFDYSYDGGITWVTTTTPFVYTVTAQNAAKDEIKISVRIKTGAAIGLHTGTITVTENTNATDVQPSNIITIEGEVETYTFKIGAEKQYDKGTRTITLCPGEDVNLIAYDDMYLDITKFDLHGVDTGDCESNTGGPDGRIDPEFVNAYNQNPTLRDGAVHWFKFTEVTANGTVDSNEIAELEGAFSNRKGTYYDDDLGETMDWTGATNSINVRLREDGVTIGGYLTEEYVAGIEVSPGIWVYAEPFRVEPDAGCCGSRNILTTVITDDFETVTIGGALIDTATSAADQAKIRAGYVPNPYVSNNATDEPNDVVKGTQEPYACNVRAYIKDHTSGNDNMLFFDVAEAKGYDAVMYTRSYAVCTETTYQLSGWFYYNNPYTVQDGGGAGKESLEPIIKVVVRRGQGHSGSILAESGWVTLSLVEDWWHQVATEVTTGEDDYITVEVISNLDTRTGNDLAMDDITFSVCVPMLTSSVNGVQLDEVDCNNPEAAANLSVDISSVTTDFKYVLWQYTDTEDNGTWHIGTGAGQDDAVIDISGEPNAGGYFTGSLTASGEIPDQTTRRWRVIVATTAQTCIDVAEGNTLNSCAIFNISEEASLNCCQMPELKITSTTAPKEGVIEYACTEVGNFNVTLTAEPVSGLTADEAEYVTYEWYKNGDTTPIKQGNAAAAKTLTITDVTEGGSDEYTVKVFSALKPSGARCNTSATITVEDVRQTIVVNY